MTKLKKQKKSTHDTKLTYFEHPEISMPLLEKESVRLGRLNSDEIKMLNKTLTRLHRINPRLVDKQRQGPKNLARLIKLYDRYDAKCLYRIFKALAHSNFFNTQTWIQFREILSACEKENCKDFLQLFEDSINTNVAEESIEKSIFDALLTLPLKDTVLIRTLVELTTFLRVKEKNKYFLQGGFEKLLLLKHAESISKFLAIANALFHAALLDMSSGDQRLMEILKPSIIPNELTPLALIELQYDLINALVAGNLLNKKNFERVFEDAFSTYELISDPEKYNAFFDQIKQKGSGGTLTQTFLDNLMQDIPTSADNFSKRVYRKTYSKH